MATENKLENMAAELKESGGYKILRRLSPVKSYNTAKKGTEKSIGLYWDFETNGLNTQSAKPIEVGLVVFEYNDETGKIFNILESIDMMEDPGDPIPDDVVKITGITDRMVKGKSFDDARINVWIDKSSLNISHNAYFDRQIAERRFPDTIGKPWACSVNDINWLDEGITNRSLQFLAMVFGFFYDAHRAEIDAQAGLHILSCTLPESNKLALLSLLEASRNTTYKIWTINSPYESKDALKERGYRWFPGDAERDKCWTKIVSKDEGAEELEWLKKEIYKRDYRPPVTKITAFDRYSVRE